MRALRHFCRGRGIIKTQKEKPALISHRRAGANNTRKTLLEHLARVCVRRRQVRLAEARVRVEILGALEAEVCQAVQSWVGLAIL